MRNSVEFLLKRLYLICRLLKHFKQWENGYLLSLFSKINAIFEVFFFKVWDLNILKFSELFIFEFREFNLLDFSKLTFSSQLDNFM